MHVARKQIQQIYLDSRHRYVGYYLRYSEESTHLAYMLEQELANLQQAFHWAIEDNKHELVARFWEAIGDFFWEHGYWQNYLEWGETALNAIRQLGRRETEA
ncbi:hypothetical protein TFLX_03969 [Thermoflexales bacterium]|nr:hypothetical protein TFLX_03969 [Thermoflexales bacterium]